MIPIDAHDLRMFCGKDEERLDFSAPFAKGGWIYAADHAIVVRIPTKWPDCELSRVPRKAETFFEKFPQCRIEWPEIDEVTVVIPVSDVISDREEEDTVTIVSRPVTRVGGLPVSSIYLDKIAKLENVRFSKRDKAKNLLYFTAAGNLQGIVMCLTRKQKDNP